MKFYLIDFFLDFIGMNNWALTKEQALVVIDKLEKLNIAILGGDVLEIINEKFKHNYDDLYCESKNNESFTSFLNRSIIKTRTCIENYKDFNNIRYVFDSLEKNEISQMINEVKDAFDNNPAIESFLKNYKKL